jgi:DNA-binding SARP family transcriptional activator
MTSDQSPVSTRTARRIWLLGALRIAGSQGDIRLRGVKTRSLLAFLALHPAAPHTREALADLLWPEAPPERARHNIANALYDLRQALGSEWLSSDGDHVALCAADLWVDVWEFERLYSAREPISLDQAVALYAGELAPELYDDWIIPRRAALHEQYLSALLGLAQAQEQQPEVARVHYQRLIAADPLHEGAYRGLMRGLAHTGRLAEALATYTRLEQTLAAELDVQPEDETRALAEALRGELELRRQHAQRSSQIAPFVGRTAERTRLLARLDQARSGRGGIAIVLGESGSGKTRLLEELARAASWRGWQLAWGRGQEFALPAPYMPFSQALAAALPSPRVQQLAGQIQPIWLSMLAGLAPQIAGTLGRPGWPQSSPDARRLPIALRHVLGGLQRIAPHLLILDDAHWADPELWPLLEELRGPLAEMAVLLVISGRIEDLRPQPPAWATLQSWDAAGALVIQLGGLSQTELGELAVAYGCGPLSPAEMAQLNQASAGNPLLALALLQGGGLSETHQGPEALIGPPALVALMLQRLEALSPGAHTALQAAAVLGYRFAYPLWEMLCAAAAALPELEQAGLIVIEPDGYRFAHDTLRACAYAHIPARQRRKLHQQALVALERWAPRDTAALLHHAEQAGDHEATARYALSAGEQALAASAFQAALRWCTQALEALPHDDLDRRYTALRGRLRALDILADREAQRRDLALLGDLAERLGDQRRQAEVRQQQADLAWATGAWDSAQAGAAAALELASQAGDVWQQARALEMLSRVAQNRGQHDQARARLVQAQALYRSIGDPAGEATTTHNLGIVVWALGEHQAAIDQYTVAARLFHDMGDLFQESRALNSLGCALWGVGGYMQARAMHERALAISRDLGDRWGEGANTLNLGHVALAIGDYVAAIDSFVTALEGFQATDNTPGIAVSLSNLGAAYRLLCDQESALAYCAEALQASQALGNRRVEGYAQHNRGLALLERGSAAEARQALELACALRAELREQDNLLESLAGLALAYLASGASEQAQDAIRKALQTLEARFERPALRHWVHYAAYRVRQAQGQQAAVEHLHQAAAAIQATAELLPAEERTRFLEQVPLNRETQAALAALTRQVQVRLARAGVPLGRKLTGDDYCDIVWTLYTPEDDRCERPDQRRQQILRRLLAEARAQDAAPTDDDLAGALGVSRRTVLRDMQQLGSHKYASATRRRARGG